MADCLADSGSSTSSKRNCRHTSIIIIHYAQTRNVHNCLTLLKSSLIPPLFGRLVMV